MKKVSMMLANGRVPSSFAFEDDVLALKAFSAMESGAGMDHFDATLDDGSQCEIEVLGTFCYMCGHEIGLTLEEGLVVTTDLGEVVCLHTDNEEVCGNTVGYVVRML